MSNNKNVNTCVNLAKVASCDEWECSNCGIILEGWTRKEIDVDNCDETFYEYDFKFCPECGNKIVEFDEKYDQENNKL